MLVQELALELLEALEQLLDSGLISHCKQLTELQREWQYMSSQVLHNVLVWEALGQVGQDRGILQSLVSIWGSLVDLDFQLIHSSLVSLCDRLAQGWPLASRHRDKALSLLMESTPRLSESQPSLLLLRLQELFHEVEEDDKEDEEDEEYNIEEDNYNSDIEEGHLLRQLQLTEEYQLSAIFSCPQGSASALKASHILAKHSLAHLRTLRKILRAMSQPHTLKPLYCLQGLLTVLQDPQCWALLVQSQSW